MNHTLLSPEQVARLRQAADSIQAFAEESDREQYMDTGDALQLMGEAHDAIEWIFTPTKDRRAEPRTYNIELNYGKDNMQTIATFSFPTHAELKAFSDGLVAAKQIGEWDVTYTDEETPEPSPPVAKPLQKFDVFVRLSDRIEADSEEAAFDMMMAAFEDRTGFEIMGHDIIEAQE